MIASARLVAHLDSRGRTSVATMHGEAPLLMRVTTAPAAPGDPLVIHLVGGAAGPLGGDRLDLDITVCDGAWLVVRSAAASLAQPGPRGGERSCSHVRAEVADGATLDWQPEPLISVAGSDHHVRSSVHLTGTARLRWVEVVVLGRADEPGGDLEVHQRVTAEGRPLVDHTVQFAGSHQGGSRHLGGRVAVTAVAVGERSETRSLVRADARGVRCAVGDSASVWSVVGADVEVVMAAFTELGGSPRMLV